jgi:hypothetical protein
MTSIWTYVWDLLDEGVDNALKVLKNSAGVDGVSIATSYHTVDHLRVHGFAPIVFRSRSAIFFKPQRELWKHTSIEPRVSPLVGAKYPNPLKLISDRCAAHGLTLNSWTVCCHNSYLAEKYPQHTTHDAFGNPSATWLCPTDPAVREYLKALARDLTTNYKISRLELEAFSFESFKHYHFHEKIGIALGDVEKFLFALCFCDNCQARARSQNVDVGRLRAVAQNALKKAFAGDPLEGTPNDFIAQTPGLDRFIAMRQDVLLSLLQEMKLSSGKSSVYFMDMGPSLLSGLSLKKAIEISPKVTILAYTPSADKVETMVRDALDEVGKPEKLHAGFHCYPPNGPDKQALVANVQRAAELGVRDVNFYNYGIMPRRNLEWVKEAATTVAARS